jgi:putative ABC transport system permease protein
VLGIAAVGALLFDMLLLSRGLVVSFRDLLNSIGYDVRVLTSDTGPIGGPRLQNVTGLARELSALPELAEVVPVRVMDAEAVVAPASARKPESAADGASVGFTLTVMDPQPRRPWTIVQGNDRDVAALLINRRLANTVGASPGRSIQVRLTCGAGRTPLPPKAFAVGAIADFPFDNATQLTAIASRELLRKGCGDAGSGGEADDADLLLIASREGFGADAAVAAIRRARPDLRPATNEEVVARMQRQGFTYFRQISAVLSTITMLFGFLLITVLLTVSVNQRLGEIAALRALGFSRARVALDVCSQSALLVGIGGLVALPLGVLLSLWLDRILKAMPGIPTALHFFVFERRALLVHVALLAATAALAAAYPVRLVTTLPIAATLRDEVVG